MTKIDQKKIQSLKIRLGSMNASSFGKIKDGKGLYLGDGHPNRPGDELRSGELEQCLDELLAWRNRFGDQYEFRSADDCIVLKAS